MINRTNLSEEEIGELHCDVFATGYYEIIEEVRHGKYFDRIYKFKSDKYGDLKVVSGGYYHTDGKGIDYDYVEGEEFDFVEYWED